MAESDNDVSFIKLAAGVATALIAAGVIGMWTMSSTLSRLDERVLNLTKTVNEQVGYATTRIDQVTKDQRDAERRLGVLEGKARL
jgi:hypothetical protein